MTTLTIIHRSFFSRFVPVRLFNLNKKTLCAACGLFLLLLVTSYVFLVVNLIAGSYLIKSYNREIDRISEENRALEIEFAESQFLKNIKAKAGALNLEKTTKLNFVYLPDGSLAKAE